MRIGSLCQRFFYKVYGDSLCDITMAGNGIKKKRMKGILDSSCVLLTFEKSTFKEGVEIMYKRSICILLSFVLMFSLVIPFHVNANNTAYTDIDGHWAKEVIEDVTQKGLFTGYDGGKFAPDNNITRAEYITILYKTLKQNGVTFLQDVGVDTEVPYKDLDEDFWGTAYIKAIFGLEDFREFGEEELFYPNKPITRSEAAQITSSFVSFTPGAESVYFTDVTDMQNRNLEFALEQLVVKGVLSGYEDNTFRPQNPIKRGEAAAIISKLYTWLHNDLTIEPFDMTALFPATQFYILMDSYTHHDSSVDKKVQQMIKDLQENYTEENLNKFADLVHQLYEQNYWNKALVYFYEAELNKDLSLAEKVDLLLKAAQFINEKGVDLPLKAGYEVYRKLYIMKNEAPDVMEKAAPYIREWFSIVTEDIRKEDKIYSNNSFMDSTISLTAYWMIETGNSGEAYEIYKNSYFAFRHVMYFVIHNYLYAGLESGKIKDGPSFTDLALKKFAINGYDKATLNLIAQDGAKLRRIQIKFR